MILLSSLPLLCGCQAWDALRETETAEFVEWFDEQALLASEVAVRDGVVTLTKPDGSIVARELPGADAVESPGAVFGERAVAVIKKSVETGSPWPAVVGIAEAAALALVGGYAASKRKKAIAAVELAETRTEQVDAMILGIRDAQVDIGTPTTARRSVAAWIEVLAEKAGVEEGPNGLKARVEKLGANVLRPGSCA